MCKFRLRDRRLFFVGSSGLFSLILTRRRFRSGLLCAVCFVLFRCWSLRLRLRSSIRRLGSRCRHFRHRFPIRRNADVILVGPPARSSESREQHNRQQDFFPRRSRFVRLGIRSQTGKSPFAQHVHIALIQTEQGRATDRWNWLAGVRPGPCWRGRRRRRRYRRRHDTRARSWNTLCRTRCLNQSGGRRLPSRIEDRPAHPAKQEVARIDLAAFRTNHLGFSGFRIPRV